MVDAALFSPSTDEWGTPQEVFGVLAAIWRFDLDACATRSLAKCTDFCDPKLENGLERSWEGRRVFCNPPYSRALMPRWAKKFARSAPESTCAIMLVPARTDTKWFQAVACLGPELVFLQGRIQFEGGEHKAPFPSMLVVIDEARRANRWTSAKISDLAAKR